MTSINGKILNGRLKSEFLKIYGFFLGLWKGFFSPLSESLDSSGIFFPSLFWLPHRFHYIEESYATDNLKFQLWKYTFNRLLVALEVFDLMFLISTVPIHTFAVFEYSNRIFALLYSRFLYPLSSVSLSASIFMTVSITVERYWAVCKPTVRSSQH